MCEKRQYEGVQFLFYLFLVCSLCGSGLDRQWYVLDIFSQLFFNTKFYFHFSRMPPATQFQKMQPAVAGSNLIF